MTQQQPSRSFTTIGNGILRVLTNECRVSEGWDPSGTAPIPPLVPFSAIWDTGATNSAISQKVVDACGLVPTGYATIQHARGREPNVPTFLVNIMLPNDVGFPGLQVSLGQFGEADDADLLIGMDIIGRDDFAVTNRDNKTKFSFRYPSLADIDFVAESVRANALSRQPLPKQQTRLRQRAKRNKGKKR